MHVKRHAGYILKLSTPVRSWTHRFSLILLVAASVGLMIVGKADIPIVERLRTAIADIFTPVLDLAGKPLKTVGSAFEEGKSLIELHEENRRLAKANNRLLRWEQLARHLRRENRELRTLLNLTIEPKISEVSGRVIADSGGAFQNSILVNAGARHGVRRGQAVVSGYGLVGRVAEVGNNSARVILLTDLNSRVPVVLLRNGARAILAGDNTEQPILTYLSDHSQARAGDRIVTSGHGGALPAGLPVGKVGVAEQGVLKVAMYEDLAQLTFVRMIEFGMRDLLDIRSPRDRRAPPVGGETIAERG